MYVTGLLKIVFYKMCLIFAVLSLLIHEKRRNMFQMSAVNLHFFLNWAFAVIVKKEI